MRNSDKASRHAKVSAMPGVRETDRDLLERVKELNCLYGFSRMQETRGIALDDVLQGLVELIPPAWQYPEVTCARVKLRNRQFATGNFRETEWRQSEAIKVNGKRLGTLEVFYLETRPDCDEGPFLIEERSLLHALAERLGRIIEHRFAEESVQTLYEREKELRERIQREMQGRVDFTRKMIHELKTPLTSLMATSQLLLDETRGTNLEKLAGYVWEGADSLNKRIEELHDVIRGEIGKLEVELRPMDIGNFLGALADEMAPSLQQQGMSIEVEFQGSLPRVQADPERLRQIIFNLVNNACKYARQGEKITIRATGRKGSVAIEVRDYGPGIPPKKQRELFKPGYQLSRHNARSGGLGIGLALCKMLVELHGGKMWLRSHVGKGSSFFFTLRAIEERRDGDHILRGDR
jgi:signal transduction histidine kinase